MQTEYWQCFAWNRRWMAHLDLNQTSRSAPAHEIGREAIDYVSNIQLIRSCALIEWEWNTKC
jgi:hypothetical protein